MPSSGWGEAPLVVTQQVGLGCAVAHGCRVKNIRAASSMRMVTRRPPRISAANSRWSLRETRPPQVLILLTISSSNTLGEGEGSRETWANLCFAAYMLATVHA